MLVSSRVGCDGIGQEFGARAAKLGGEFPKYPVNTGRNARREEHWRVVGVGRTTAATLGERFHGPIIAD
jgi:hypothetical protein